MFACTPQEALEQDWEMVKRIMDYRTLERAKELHNTDVTRMTPGMVELWKEAVEAAENG